MADLSAGNRHSRISVLLPEPRTPVTSTSRPRGNRTVRFFRLFLLAPLSVSHRSSSCTAGADAGRLGLTSAFGLWTLDLGLWTSPRPTVLRFPRVGKLRCARRH